MAREMTDIALDGADDLDFLAGDFLAVESTLQHQRQLILNNKREFKENPEVCVGVFNYIDDEHVQGLARAISAEFARDGMDVKRVKILPDGTVESEAGYR